MILTRWLELESHSWMSEEFKPTAICLTSGAQLTLVTRPISSSTVKSSDVEPSEASQRYTVLPRAINSTHCCFPNPADSDSSHQQGLVHQESSQQTAIDQESPTKFRRTRNNNIWPRRSKYRQGIIAKKEEEENSSGECISMTLMT